jgi:RHS repeat-associated protein
MLMPGRTYSAQSGYRYGFNGKEMDNEAKGTGVQYDYGFRIYDPRVGRFSSVDPLTNSYPWFTPYQFAGNMPVAAIDLDGLENKVVINWITIGLDGKTNLEVITKDYPKGQVGPLGKGTLTEYRIDSRMKNEDYGKKGSPLSKTISFPKHESYAQFEPATDADDETRKRGGLFFISKYGSGAGSGPDGELQPGDGEPINVDLFIEAAGGYRDMTPWEGGDKLPFLKRLYEVLDDLQKATETLKKGQASAEEGPEVLNKILEKKAEEIPDQNTGYCEAHKSNYIIGPDKQLTDVPSKRKAVDTFPAHGEPSKSRKTTQPSETKDKKKG